MKKVNMYVHGFWQMPLFTVPYRRAQESQWIHLFINLATLSTLGILKCFKAASDSAWASSSFHYLGTRTEQNLDAYLFYTLRDGPHIIIHIFIKINIYIQFAMSKILLDLFVYITNRLHEELRSCLYIFSIYVLVIICRLACPSIYKAHVSTLLGFLTHLCLKLLKEFLVVNACNATDLCYLSLGCGVVVDKVSCDADGQLSSQFLPFKPWCTHTNNMHD